MNINEVWPEWYEECVLGEGSFGKVYRAKRTEYGRTFYSAIKVLSVPKSQQEIKHARAQGMNDQDIYNYFHSLVDNLLNEITLMDNLKGAQNIVGIEDYKIIERQGEIGWDIFIRMELLSPFDSFVSNPEFSQKDVIKLGIDICTALESCEQNYIVHRDIKPDNIFYSRFGEYKLGDFGIARRLEATQANVSRKGTLNYMAPEVYKSEAYGPNVDIYSLGMVLYTLLNNNRIAFLPPYPQPITYSDNEEALTRRLSGEYLPPPCNADASLAAIIQKACAYHPQERYQTATELKRDLVNEWNRLLAGGINQTVCMMGTQPDSIAQQMAHTTNDMTANGKMVAQYYEQGTTVLDNGMQYQADTQPIQPQTVKTGNWLMRILAWPAAIAVCILAVLLLTEKSQEPLVLSCAVAMVALGANILLADRTKFSIGLCVIGISFSYLLSGASVLLADIHLQTPVEAIITVLSGLLFLSGGLAVCFQQGARLGGQLCLYGIILEWGYRLYEMLYQSSAIPVWHIYIAVSMLAVLIWAMGYQKSQLSGVQKVLCLVSCVIGAAALTVSALWAWDAAKLLFV